MRFSRMQAAMWFGLGLVAGAVLMGFWMRFHFSHPPMPPGPDHLIRMFAQGLNLSEKQYADLREVINRHEPQFKAMHEEQMARMEGFKNAVQDDIRKLLDDRQRAEFDRRMKEQEARWKRGPRPPLP